jgi:hypothetical protein
MFVSKLKTWTVLLVLLAVLGGGTVAYQLTAAPPPEKKKEAPRAGGKETNDEVARLLKKKVELASEGLKAAQQEFLAGRSTGEDLYEWSKRYLDAQRELNSTRADHEAALKAHLERMKEYEMIFQAKYQAGRLSFKDVCHAQLVRVEAELWLVRHKGK